MRGLMEIAVSPSALSARALDTPLRTVRSQPNVDTAQDDTARGIAISRPTRRGGSAPITRRTTSTQPGLGNAPSDGYI